MTHAERLQARHRGEHGGCARHVGLHGLHAGRRLEREATRIEDDSLADKSQRSRLALPARLIRHLDEPWWARRALTDTEHAAHLLGPQLGLGQDREGHALAGQEPSGGGSELRRRLGTRRLVHHVPRPGHRISNDRAPLETGADLGGSTDDVDTGELGRLTVRLVLEEPIRAEDKAFGDGLPHQLGRGSFRSRLRERRDDGASPGRASGDRRGRAPQGVRGDGLWVTHADQHRARGGGRPRRGHDQRLIGLPAKSRLDHEVTKRPVKRSVDGVRPGSEYPFREDGHGQQVTGGSIGRLVRHAKSNRHRPSSSGPCLTL